jgi:2-polyprenyl-6-methoxyphenol hydroxylase-like FAD-dependent oxidoreductase
MNETSNTDVVIIGAGPTGLALACQFIRHGVDFIILDKAEGITPYSRAIGVQARTLEIYEQIDLARSLVSQGLITERAMLLEGGEVRGELNFSDIGEGLSPYPFLLICEQSRHERLLYDFIKAHGRDVLWRTELESFSQDADGVRANVKTADGAMRTIEARFLVGCDGAKSIVRHALGMEFEGSTFERLFYVADVRIDWRFGHDALMACLAQNTLTAFFPMKGESRYRIIGTFPENESRREGEILYEEIERQIVEDTKLDLDISQVNWFSVYRVHSRRVNKFSAGRCFLAGDAAHVHTPAGGQGMNTGIQDGYNLAWKLALVLRGRADARLLETYNAERLANAKRLLETTDRMFDYATSDEWFIAYLRTHVFPHVGNFILHLGAIQRLIFPLVSQIGITYRDSSLSAHDNDAGFKVQAGDRMPYFLIDGVSVYDRLRQPKFHLLVFSDGQSDHQELKTKLEREYDQLVDCHVLPLHPRVTETFGTERSFSLLLRPDNHIGFISPKISFAEVRTYLGEHLRRS